MSGIFTRFKNVLGNHRYATSLSLMAGLFVIASISSFAEGTADTATVTAITGAFEDVKATGLAALAAVGVVAIVLFGGIYAWKYGKKVFSVIAK